MLIIDNTGVRISPRRPKGKGWKLVCSWCKCVMREGDEPASHGICQACEANELAKLPMPPDTDMQEGD